MAVVGAALGAFAMVSVSVVPSASAAEALDAWHLDAMKAEQMWKVSTGEGVTVAVIDTGVNADTSALEGQVVEGDISGAAAYKATVDYTGHGTSMAETIAGTGAGGGIKGLAPDAKIVPIRIDLKGLEDKADRKKAPSIAEAIRAAADSDAKIISMSFTSPYIIAEEAEAVAYAYSKGKLLFAGVGNEAEKDTFGGKHIGYPAGYPYVVGVSAADKTGTVGKFSEHGADVDLAAPGLDLPAWCDRNFTRYCTVEGTSSATAVASASAALVWSAHPDWTNNQVLNALLETAGRDWPREQPSNYLGYGLIRPRVVLAEPGFDPGAPDADPLIKEHESAFKASSDFKPTPEPIPSTSAGASSGAEAEGEAPADAGKPAAGGEGETAAAEAGDGSSLVWPIAGAIAAVVVIGGVTVVVLRKRRSA
ncbi:S8 family serine peptidase [Streptomyces sp. NPDC047130]|uniref:S8 family serine peptidase n=1 Tax=Streptomyces sp. NPDC047130 TaxID=3155261 RepID=UPI0033C46089